jgi:hypothetical protein
MNNALQYICDSEGQTVSVVVPIALWQEIIAERETAYLLSSPAMITTENPCLRMQGVRRRISS